MRYRRNKDKQKLVIASLLMLICASVLSISRAREALDWVTTPLVGVSASANGALEFLLYETKSRNELLVELKKLKEENRTLVVENLNQQILRQYNKELKERLDWTDITQSFSIARIISRPPITPFDSFTVEISTDKEIKKGQRVRVTDTVEVGSITTVNSKTAIVKLYTSPGVKTPVEINGKGALVVAEGAGAGSFTIRAPRSYEIKKGDYLTRPGADSLIIGVVESISRDEADSFALVRARLPVNLFEVTWVHIETTK